MKHLLIIILLTSLISCGSSKNFTAEQDQEYQTLKDLVRSKDFAIRSTSARPMVSGSLNRVANTGILGAGNSAGNIDISGNSNELKVQGDSVSGYFPYYGEVHSGGGYMGTNHQGIEFNGIPENYKLTENDAKHSVQIEFRIDDKFRNNERYDVFITLFPSNRSTIQITSSNRSTIEYSGMLKQVSAENKKQP